MGGYYVSRFVGLFKVFLMFETILLSGAFMVAILIGVVVLVNNYKIITDERDKHYKSEMKHIREEVTELKGIIKKEMITIIKKINDEKTVGKNRGS